MATIGSTFLDLIDVYKQSNDAKQIATVIEILKTLTPIMDDAVAVECNMGSQHRHSIRTGLPAVAWGQLYQGIPQSKSNYQSVDDTTGWVEGLSSVDERLLKLNPAKAPAVRLNEANGYLEAMAQEAAKGIIYYDTKGSPEKIKGLSARYGKLGGATSGNQIIDAGGTGSDNTSIWFVTWGAKATSLLYPEGTKAGVDREDMGRQRVLDASNNPYYVEEEKFTQHLGVAVGDWRYNSRIANIDVSDMEAGNVDLYKFMRKAYYRLQSRVDRRGGGDSGVEPMRQAIYCNRDVLEALDGLATNAGATDNFVRLTPMEIEGKEVLTYRGIPVRQLDCIVENETRVV